LRGLERGYKMARKIFLRGKWRTYSKLGRGRKKKQKYRKATGIHNKIRLEMKGNPVRVKIGYKGSNKEKKIIVRNGRELKKAKKGEKVILARVGKKKKLEIIKKAQERGVIIVNANPKKLLEKMKKEKPEERGEKNDKKENKSEGTK